MLRPRDEGLFGGFGRSARIGNCRAPLARVDLAVTRRKTRALLRTHAPAAPGVYGMVNETGELVYVGKSKSLRHRLISYFQKGARAEKAGCIVSSAVQIVWERTTHEFAALVRELELIRRFRPRYNVEGQPGGMRRGWLCLGRAPAPYLFLSPTVTATAEQSYGPLSIGRRMRRAVERVNNLFGLRDCSERVPMHFADQLPLFDQPLVGQCLRYDLGTCLGPCAGACSRRKYRTAVRAALSLLDGREPAKLEQLAVQMQLAADALQFERAAQLRDTLDDVNYLCRQVEYINDVRRNWTFIYAPTRPGRRPTWYFLQNGLPIGACRAPVDGEQAHRVRDRLQHLYRGDLLPPDAIAEETLPFVLLVARWFRRHPEQLTRTLSIDAALEHCRALISHVA